MSTFFLIRHAETDAVGKVLAGRMPGVALNKTGERQASRLAEILGPAAFERDRQTRLGMFRGPYDDKEWTSYHPDGKKIFTAFTNGLKKRQIGQYGYADTEPAHYEEDHLIPLELGGAPRSAKNLWPEPLTAALSDGVSVGADVKDRLEDDLNRKVCAGAMTLAAARQAIAIDWVAAWNQAGRP